jgi:hypothetical protein
VTVLTSVDIGFTILTFPRVLRKEFFLGELRGAGEYCLSHSTTSLTESSV